MFETIIVQPIYNILVALYGLLPGNDLGISLVLFTLLVRLALWPLLKKQLHQTKMMRKLQPELKKIKKAANGDRQKEAALMMELYKEKGVSPMGSIGLTLIQLPLFIGVFQAARILTENVDRIDTLTYSFVRDIPHIQTIVADSSKLDFVSLGFIDLSQKAFLNGKIYFPILAIGILATVLQFLQSKQIMPQAKNKKKLRDIMKESAASGKQPESEDMTAAMGSTMLYLMPVLTIMFVLYSHGAMVVYLLASSVIGIIQQTIIFKKDTDEMEDIAEVVSVKKSSNKKSQSKIEIESEVTHKITKGKITTKSRVISGNKKGKK